MNDMVLLHENDTHFNLIISEDSDLGKFGSLSHRFHVGPQESDTTDKRDESESNEVTEPKEPKEPNESESETVAKLKILPRVCFLGVNFCKQGLGYFIFRKSCQIIEDVKNAYVCYSALLVSFRFCNTGSYDVSGSDYLII